LTLEQIAQILDSGKGLHAKTRADLDERYARVQDDTKRCMECVEKAQVALAAAQDAEVECWRLIRLDEARKEE